MERAKIEQNLTIPTILRESFMKKIANLSVLLILLAAAGCQQAQSAKPNQDNALIPCPAVHTTAGDFARVVVVRLKSGTDILEGLNEAIQKEKIRNAVILTGIGSLTRYHFHDVNNSSFPTTQIFVKRDAPVDLLNVNGYVFDGRVHAHITVSNDREAVGGHLEDDTRVFTFAIITLGVLDGRANLQRFDDSKWR
jgi:predicted DNA-binding protein with PD1-like motif